MGLLGTVSAAGTALGPSLGGVLVGGFGWRALFLVQAVLGGAALLCTYSFLPGDTACVAGRASTTAARCCSP
jgi:predicted MFS family arabinose efflux permease